MPRENVEFEFPDPDKDEVSQEVEVDIEEEDAPLEIEGAVGREDMKTSPKKAKEDSFEIEIEDDTPVADRGRRRSKPPEEVTDEELENYSEKVKGRIKHFSKGYHDERRAKETALREREELEAYTKNLLAENNELKGTVDKNQHTMVEQAKQTVGRELELAKRQYKDAYESGDSNALVDAQEAIATAKIRADKVASYRPAPLQKEETPVQVPQRSNKTETFRDEQAAAWADENSWFGSETPDGVEMTAFALGLDAKLKKTGVDPQSNEYYEQINARMRQVFPDQFDDGIEDKPVEKKRKSSNVVAPATRSTSSKKVTLTQSQVAIAKRLGVPLEIYAKQAAELTRKQQ
jgi:hypothetical protein|tara:strand:+ start:152 stop:1195 length:1044 start_codon:yes stop_codon:yes gene_type:complete